MRLFSIDMQHFFCLVHSDLLISLYQRRNLTCVKQPQEQGLGKSLGYLHIPLKLWWVAHRQSAARLGAIRSGVSLSCFSSSSSTPRPPVWMQKCSKASAKSGRYALQRTPSTCATTCRTHHDKLSVTEAHSGALEHHDMAHILQSRTGSHTKPAYSHCR